MRRVGQSMRLRRGNTSTTPGGHDAVDVPVSQGILRLNSSDDDCVSHVAEGGSSSLDKQVRCYLRPLRRRASKVEEPSLASLPPVPVSRTGDSERVEAVGSSAASGVECGGGGDDAMAASTARDGARMLHGQIDVQGLHATGTDNAAMVGAAVVRRSARIASRSAGSGVAGASVGRVADGGRGRSAGRSRTPSVQGRGCGQGCR